MTTTDDHGNLHDRTGKFTRKVGAAPSGSLTPDEVNTQYPLSIAILPEPDPNGGYDLAVDAPTGRYFLRDGQPHREDGPAYEGRDGTKEWRVDGALHRPGGAPAVIHDDGSEELWEHGEPIAL